MNPCKAQSELSVDKCIEPSARLASEEKPKVLHRGFTIKVLPSQGARSICYLAQLTETNEEFVLKKNSQELGKREVECLQALNPHNNIVQLLDFIPPTASNPEYSIALELADCDLANLIGYWGEEKACITIGHMNNIFSQLLSAYLHIRKKGLLKHTDFSDRNTLYFSSGCRLKVCDFNSDLLDICQYDIHLLKSMSRLLFEIAHRIAHKCDAVTGKYYPAPMCKANCFKMFRESPNSETSDWKKLLSEKQVELTVKMNDGLLSSEKDIDTYQRLFTDGLDVLPNSKNLR